jgi:hypothetical protein
VPFGRIIPNGVDRPSLPDVLQSLQLFKLSKGRLHKTTKVCRTHHLGQGHVKVDVGERR